SISGWNSGNSNSLSVQGGQLRGRNVGTTGRTWQTESINIHGYTSVSFSLNVRTNGSFEYGDYIIGEYRADGGSWEEFLDVSRSSLNNLNGTYTENIPPNTRTLEIRVRMSNNSTSEYFYIDDVIVQGTLDLCHGELDFEFYDGNFSNSVDNIPTSGALGRGTVDHFNVNTLQNQEDPGDEDSYGIRYSGYIQIDDAGNYDFFTWSDDGSKLYIDGNQVVNNDNDHGDQERKGTVYLTTGLHDITVLFYENGGGANLRVQYDGPEFTKRDVPFSKFYSNCTPHSSEDLDGDGVENSADLDSDGDGILDTVECDELENYIESVTAFGNFSNPGNVLGNPGSTYAQSNGTWGSSSYLLLDFGEEIPVGTPVSVFLESSFWGADF